MCGIVGFLDPTLGAVEASGVLAGMRAAVRHRGPDDSGQCVSGVVGLAMQRLSIIDLAGGAQPMSGADGQVWIVYNGELFNDAELRSTLKAAGRHFRTRSDTEVMLAQYERYGLDGLSALNGMFAAAIWDQRECRLHLVRDRMGVKPLYYFRDGTRLYFASEIKALVAAGQFRPAVNAQAIWDYLTFRYVPGPETIFKSIFKLPPAHTLTVSPDDLAAPPHRWWDMPYADSGHARADDQTTFDELFRDAVNRRMVADVPVGIFLSGGLDSSAVAAAVDRTRFPDLKTFAVSLDGGGEDDERAYARLVAEHLRTDHHELVVRTEQFIDFLDNLPLHTDEPLADPTCVPLYFLAKAARREVKVVLSGEGSDEILGGYTFDVVRRQWDQAVAAAARPTAGCVSRVARVLGGRGVRKDVCVVDQRRAPVPLHITNYYSCEEKRALFRDGMAFRDSIDVLRRDLARVVDPDPLHQSLYLYCQNWLVEDLLMKADKMTMAASLELRTPFLDYRLVEWAARAPVSSKLRPLANGGYETKAALRAYARKLLPAEIINRPKKGFPVPVYRWMSNHLRPLVLDRLTNPSALCLRWLDLGAVRRVAEAGTAPDADILARHRAWNLLLLELWLACWST